MSVFLQLMLKLVVDWLGYLKMSVFLEFTWIYNCASLIVRSISWINDDVVSWIFWLCVID